MSGHDLVGGFMQRRKKDMSKRSYPFLGVAPSLVGGLVAIFYFPIYREFHHPN